SSSLNSAPARRRVLIVDDNEDGAEMLAIAMQALGHSTCLAKDGESALTAAAEFRPEVALLDIGLPGMDGFELARRLQSDLGERAPILIAITGYGQDADRARTRQAGFAHHLVKPVELTSLEALLLSLPS